MRLLLGLTRWAAYTVAWFGCWAGVGAVLTWRSFRKHPRSEWLVRS